eukprot:SAG22_NODE_7164_length_769_cov_0.514925_1_plen_179_part_10
MHGDSTVTLQCHRIPLLRHRHEPAPTCRSAAALPPTAEASDSFQHPRWRSGLACRSHKPSQGRWFESISWKGLRSPSSVAQWLACQAHNLEDGGSKPPCAQVFERSFCPVALRWIAAAKRQRNVISIKTNIASPDPIRREERPHAGTRTPPSSKPSAITHSLAPCTAETVAPSASAAAC